MKKRHEVRIQYRVGYSCNCYSTVTGTPVKVTKAMYKDRSPFLEVKSFEDYMKKLTKRIRTVDGVREAVLRGKTKEQRCASFLKIMLKCGFVKELPLKAPR